MFFFSSVISQAEEDQIFEINVSKNLLGTVIEAKVISKDITAAKKALYFAFKEIERIDSLFSFQNKNSVISRINKMAGISAVKVSRETYELISDAKEFSKKYQGLFDITIGSISVLWGFNSDGDIQIPSKTEIENLLPTVDYRLIELDKENLTVFLKKKDMKIDPGGIAKGYAVDRAAALLIKQGLNNFMLNAGGDVYAAGKNAEGLDWSIGIKHPRKNDEALATVRVNNLAVSTSGDYERHIIKNGKRYHHILLPATGYSGDLCQSVTVLTDNSEEGTVLAKYIFLLGYEKFASTKFAATVKYLLVSTDGSIKFSPELKENDLILIK